MPRVTATAASSIGQVLDVAQHPDADRLSVCTVRLSGSDERTIVCGAPNVAAGQAVMVALPGAVLPDGTRLGKAKLRGVESEGMILSETEVQLGSDSEGIMVLPDASRRRGGAALLLPVGDDVLELEVTPNRPDCLAVYGVAREVHAVTGAPLAPDPVGRTPTRGRRAGRRPDVEVEVDDFELCPRFSVRVFTDVKVGPSPLWLKARLMAAGQRPISNVVDITNYVMLLRAADARLRPRPRRRPAAEGARGARGRAARDARRRAAHLRQRRGAGLRRGRPDGARRDHGRRAQRGRRRPRRVSRWRRRRGTGPNILHTSKKLGLRSEASTRFEKQLAPALALQAQRWPRA